MGRPYAKGHVVIYAYDADDGQFYAAQRDHLLGNLVVTDSPHHEVHEGRAFAACYLQPHASLLADDGSLDFLIAVGELEAHVEWRLSAGGDFELHHFEGTEVTDAGTEVTAHNRRRASTRTPTTAVTHTPTISDDGTLLSSVFIAGGAGLGPGTTQGGAVRPGLETILAPSTTYLLRATNRAGSAQQFSIEIEWYEE